MLMMQHTAKLGLTMLSFNYGLCQQLLKYKLVKDPSNLNQSILFQFLLKQHLVMVNVFHPINDKDTDYHRYLDVVSSWKYCGRSGLRD